MNIKRDKTAFTRAVSRGTIGAIAAGALLAGMAPAAGAYGGVEESTATDRDSSGGGIVWGAEEEGTYMIPLVDEDGKSLGEIEGFCLDAGAAYPKQTTPGEDGGDVEGTTYSGPHEWTYGNGLSPEDKASLVAALMVGEGASEGEAEFKSTVIGLGLVDKDFDFVESSGEGVDSVPGTLDEIAAGAAMVVHEIGAGEPGIDKPGLDENYTPNPSNPGYKYYEAISAIDSIPESKEGVEFQIYLPENEDYQRMISFDVPKEEEEPSTPPDETDDSVAPTTPSTTPSTTTSTPPEEEEEDEDVEIRTNASSSTGNVIQAGTTVDDTVTYRGLTPDREYRLEARLMCKANGEDTGASETLEFTPEEANGEVVVEGIAVTDSDCNEQVAFEKLYEVETDLLVASHEDITDSAQTVGGEKAPNDKKEAPVGGGNPQPNQPSDANADANANANANASANSEPQGTGGVGGGGDAPRQVINSVPSGNTNVHGADIFSR